MLVPAEGSSRLVPQLGRYCGDRIAARNASVVRALREITVVLQEVLREVELQEPRVISSLAEVNGRYEGLHVLSPTHFEAILYLNQMGEFNFVDDGSFPGSAVLKLSDGRKRSMSLWVEFITASGYLSSRKMRARLQSLVAAAVEKIGSSVEMITDSTEIKLRVKDKYTVQMIPAFKCTGVWPRSAAHWPSPHVPWPNSQHVAEVKSMGFDLVSRENGRNGSGGGGGLEADAWVMSFPDAEDRLLKGGSRKRCLSLLKALRDRHLSLPGDPVPCRVLTALTLHECEKHPRESDWEEMVLGERLLGVLLQLITCLQCRKCPHYFLPAINLLRAPPSALEAAARQAWRLARDLLTNPKGLDKL